MSNNPVSFSNNSNNNFSISTNLNPHPRFVLSNFDKEVNLSVDENGNLEVDPGIKLPLLSLFDLILQGKTLEKDTDKFLEEIKKLPYVRGDNLKAMAVFNRFRKFVENRK